MTKDKPASKTKHPYMSGAGGVTQTVNHLRKQFSQPVNAETLRKLGIAPNNETYVLNILRFVNVIDTVGNKTQQAGPIFNQSEDAEFQKGFAGLVKAGYTDLFQLHGEEAWSLSTTKLLSFFRNSDQTSALVGNRQTSTFVALASLAGKRNDVPKVKSAASAPKASKQQKAPIKSAAKPAEVVVNQSSPPAAPHAGMQHNTNVGLTVRIEVNLPAGGDQATYDAIFRSIREHIINGNGA